MTIAVTGMFAPRSTTLTLEDELTLRGIPILDTKEVNSHKREMLKKRRRGFWRRYWPFAFAIGWVLGFHLGEAGGTFLLFACVGGLGLSAGLWALQVPLMGELFLGIFGYFLFAYLTSKVLEKGWFPDFFDAISFWERTRFCERKWYLRKDELQYIGRRAKGVERIPKAKVYVEHLEEDLLLLVVRGSERCHIGTCKTRSLET